MEISLNLFITQYYAVKNLALHKNSQSTFPMKISRTRRSQPCESPSRSGNKSFSINFQLNDYANLSQQSDQIKWKLSV